MWHRVRINRSYVLVFVIPLELCNMPHLPQLLVCAFLLSLSMTAGAPADDLVSGAELPGWNADLPSKWYSGWLPVGAKKLHYMFVESEGSPSTDPVVLWARLWAKGGQAISR